MSDLEGLKANNILIDVITIATRYALYCEAIWLLRELAFKVRNRFELVPNNWQVFFGDAEASVVGSVDQGANDAIFVKLHCEL